MAHKRISDLNNLTTPDNADLLAVVDVSETNVDQQTKHMTIGQLSALLGTPTSANGTATIPNGSTSVTVNHGITNGTVEEIHKTNINLTTQWSVENKTATSFDIVLLTSPGPLGASFWWKVVST